MSHVEGWPNVGRVVWLNGGIVAYSNSGTDEVEVCAGSNGSSIHSSKISSYGSLFEVLRKQGFTIIGTTFVQHPDELNGLRPAEFRLAGSNNGWPFSDLRQQWREVAFLASKQDQMSLMDISSRLAFGLEHSQLRLYDLVSAYALQLRASWDKNKSLEYRRFKDLNSRDVYKSIHALFWELVVLRDTLAEFAATFCFSQPGTRTLKKLVSFLKTAASDDPLSAELISAFNEESGWLARLASYRNFFTHIAPMEWAAGIAFSIQDVQTLRDQSKVPQIYYPLPRDIEALTRERSTGVFYPSMESLLEASKRLSDRSTDPDALDYLHRTMNQFAGLAKALLDRSPLAPAPIRFGPGDIIGEIQWSPGTSG